MSGTDRNTVLIAYEKALELMATEGFVSGPKKLGCFGASYLYPVFVELGICSKDRFPSPLDTYDILNVSEIPTMPEETKRHG